MEREDDLEPKKPRPLSAAKMSKVPSWISVGFVLGALVGWTLRAPKPQPPPPVKIVEVTKLEPRPNKLATVEALFEQWKHLAGWRDDTAEFLVWNSDTKKFSEAYEVRRVGEDFYFRSIPQLTRKLVDYGDRLPPDAPIQFAGVEDRRRPAFGR
jgi:hypothetical protein